MGCFENLVKSRFLQDVSKELRMARQTLKSNDHPLVFLFDKKSRKRLFDEFVYTFYLREEIADSLKNWDHSDLIYFITVEDYLFAYSKNKSQIREAALYNYNQTGQFPFYQGKLIVEGTTIHTLLIDKHFNFQAVSPN